MEERKSFFQCLISGGLLVFLMLGVIGAMIAICIGVQNYGPYVGVPAIAVGVWVIISFFMWLDFK